MTKDKVKQLLSKIVILKVREKVKHKNADRLWVVKLGNDRKEIQVVTGANNFEEGDLVAFLAAGNIVPGVFFNTGEKIALEEKKLRGEVSQGMLLSEKETGIGVDHDGIMIIDKDNKYIGKSILEILNSEQLEKIFKKAGVIEITSELQKKLDLIMSVGSSQSGGEVVGEDQLVEILTSGEKLFTYDGFEPSGQMHIAQGIIRAINTNKMIKAGFTFRMWVADWFGYLNNKMGGDMEKIQKVGNYFIEIWKAVGMNLEKTEFLWTSDFIDKKEYWEIVMRVMKNTSLKRILRTTEIMGRSETDDLSAAQVLYPAMQVTDIFKVINCQVTQLGLDQRKVNMLAREIGPELGFWKPVVVSHGMLQGLGKPLPKDADPASRAISMKMSKSKPDTAIFMTDSSEEVARKIKKAYCPPGEEIDNPILDYCKQVIFEAKYLIREKPLLENGEFLIEREKKYGGKLVFRSYQELEAAYKKGEDELHPEDLKKSVIRYVNELLKPVKNHFKNDKIAGALLEEVQTFQITR